MKGLGIRQKKALEIVEESEAYALSDTTFCYAPRSIGSVDQSTVFVLFISYVILQTYSEFLKGIVH